MNNIEQRVKEMAAKYPPPQAEKLERRSYRLERMLKFYEDKAPQAPEMQGLMFMGFVRSLNYAITILQIHRKLTIELAELAEAENDKT